MTPIDEMAEHAAYLSELLGLGDPAMTVLVEAELSALEAGLARASARAAGPDDHKPAFLTITAGSGGREACNWAEMLLRMYCKHAIKVGLSMELIDMTPYEPDGIRTATLRLAGDNPYGRLKTESGVHRLSRVSPFDQADRRQTSFASVEVIPEAREAKLVVDPKEIEAWTCCGGGPGGQHVNKRETVACFRHIPTGISVRCQNERSQAANKVAAMGLLMAKLAKKLDEDRRTEEAKSRDAAPRAAFGGRHARTYVLSQRPAIHDHRTGKSTSQVDDVLNGDLSDLL